MITSVETLAVNPETRIWTGFRDDPATRFRLSFAEAFDIVRGNATVLQTVKSRECAESAPSCGADLPARARQSLDAFDDLARATVNELATAIGELAQRPEPRPHRVVFLTAGLPYRREPRRELDNLKAVLRRSETALSIVAAEKGRPVPGLASLQALADAPSPAMGTSREAVPVARPTDEPSGEMKPLPSEVAIASRHAVAFAENAETLLADEHYVQEVKTRPSSTSMPQFSTAGITLEKRQLDSEVALVQLKTGDLWLVARDVQKVDDRPLDAAQRLPLPSISASSDAEAVKQLRAIAAQGARFNVGGIRRDLNTPTLALWLLTPSVVSRFDFSIGGTQTIDGHQSVVVSFKERKAPYLFNVDDVPVPATGRFWLDRERQAVIRTELMLRAGPGQPRAQAQIVVNYGFDAKAGAWVPRDMREQYNAAINPQFVVANATYSNVRRFSSSIRIVK
jgi:hypothetical protein